MRRTEIIRAGGLSNRDFGRSPGHEAKDNVDDTHNLAGMCAMGISTTDASSNSSAMVIMLTEVFRRMVFE